MGKKAIPALLEHLADTEIAPMSTLIFVNPMLSWIPPGSDHDQPAGVLYAYVIELIVAKAALSDDGGSCSNFLLNKNDYVYGRGLIMHGDEIINAGDLPRIKQIYLQWWDRNRSKSLARIRREWKASHRPLTGTQYNWF